MQGCRSDSTLVGETTDIFISNHLFSTQTLEHQVLKKPLSQFKTAKILSILLFNCQPLGSVSKVIMKGQHFAILIFAKKFFNSEV